MSDLIRDPAWRAFNRSRPPWSPESHQPDPHGWSTSAFLPLDLELIPVDCIAGEQLSFYTRLGVVLSLPVFGSLALIVLAGIAYLLRRCKGGSFVSLVSPASSASPASPSSGGGIILG